MRTPLFLFILNFGLLEKSFIIHCIPEVHVHFHDFEHLFALQAKAIIINIGLRVKYAPGKGFNQLNFIPL